MNTNIIYKKDYHIGISDVDFVKKLKLSTLFTYFQDIASAAVDHLGIGINTLEQKHGVAWILTRIKVNIVRNPVWNENIIIETWPQEPKKFAFERDFIIKDKSENIIIRAISKWIILDIKTRKLKRNEEINIKYPDIIKERALDSKLKKLVAFGDKEIAYKRKIGYSDIDFNGHLNNSKYIDFIMDCFTIEEHQKYKVNEIEVTYINETLPGDCIILFKDTSAVNLNMIYVEGINEESGQAIFKAEIKIGDK